MLQNRINECRVLMSVVSENKATEANNQTIAKNNNTFFDAYKGSFLDAVKSYLIIKKYYEEFDLSDELKSSYNFCVNNTLSIFSEQRVINPIRYKKSVDDLNKNLQTVWTEYIRLISDELKDSLNILRLVYSDKGEISKLIVALNKAEVWPIEEDNQQMYRLAKEKAEDILSKMNYDTEIQIFLKKVRDKEATLFDLTDSVRKWLAEEGLENNITIGFK